MAEVDMVEWAKDLGEKLKVVHAYSEFEAMRFRGEIGMKILRKLYPWLSTMERKRNRKPLRLIEKEKP